MNQSYDYISHYVLGNQCACFNAVVPGAFYRLCAQRQTCIPTSTVVPVIIIVPPVQLQRQCRY